MLTHFLFENLDKILLALLILSGVLVTWGIIKDNERNEALMQECLQDGNKRYQCVAMLRGGGSHVQPVAVPIVVGR